MPGGICDTRPTLVFTICALVVCHHRVRFLCYPSSISFLKQNQREQELSRKCRRNRKPFTISDRSFCEPHLQMFIGSRVTRTSVVQESLLQCLFLSQKSKIFPNCSTRELLAGKYILPARPSFWELWSFCDLAGSVNSEAIYCQHLWIHNLALSLSLSLSFCLSRRPSVVLGKYIFGGGYFCEWFYGHLEVVAAVAQIISKFRTSSVCCVLCVNPTGSLKWVWVGESMKKKLEV